MTDTANAPERIWAFHAGPMVGLFIGKKEVGTNVAEYVLAAHCDELVAAAYLDAATIVLQSKGALGSINLADSVARSMPANARAALTARDERMKAEGAREAQVELIEEPTEPGSFVGDIWFGRQDNRTYGTHRWDGAAWQALPTETEALIGLLAKERVKIARLTEALKEIAHQKKTSELDTEYDVECADFEAGYDACIDRARAALQENANE